MSGFPSAGDNFRCAGEWRILEGNAWQDWQRAAIEAAIAAASAAGESFDVARLSRDLRRFEAGPPDGQARSAAGQSGSRG